MGSLAQHDRPLRTQALLWVALFVVLLVGLLSGPRAEALSADTGPSSVSASVGKRKPDGGSDERDEEDFKAVPEVLEPVLPLLP